MAKRYKIKLSDDERQELTQLTRRNKTGAKKFVRARTLLLCDSGPHGPGWSNDKVAEALGITPRTVGNIKKRLAEGGMAAALNRKRRSKPPRESIFDGEKEARLIALACSPPPEGYNRWTVRLLAEELVALQVFDHISKSSVHKALKKTNLSLT